ncbi:MAG: transcription antitermination factor NusB [Lachnospiraceae bacterium]|nr:transcription antitermination factor NusB [Lachnospiraceae bacterium]
MTRHDLREQVFQLLFRVEFVSMEDMEEQVKLFFDYNDLQFNENDSDFIRARYEAIVSNLSKIDETIEDKVTGWTISRIGKVELAVLRIAVYEILFDDDIAPGIAIDEAVEIAKKYGQANSGSFVNGVLAKLVKTDD